LKNGAFFARDEAVWIQTSDGFGSNFLTWVGSGHFLLLGLGQVGSATSRFGKSLFKIQIFQFFFFGQKNHIGLCQTQVSLLFNAGQTYARVRSGLGGSGRLGRFCIFPLAKNARHLNFPSKCF